MTPEEVIRLAREADLATEDEILMNLEWTGTQEDLERFAALIAAHEREACAAFLESGFDSVCAAAIRARTNA